MDKQKIYLEKEFREIIENRIGGVGCVNGLVSDLADKCATVNSINGTNLFINQGMEGDCVIIITPAELAVLLPNLHMFKNLRQLVVTKFVDLPYISQWTESLEEVVLHREYNALSDLCRLPKLRKVSLLYKDADIAVNAEMIL